MSGAGIANAGTLTLSDDTVTGNKTTLSGGGIYNTGMLTALDSTISNNQAAWGAGIANTGTLDVEDSTFSGNTALGNNGQKWIRTASRAPGGGGGASALAAPCSTSAAAPPRSLTARSPATRRKVGNGATSFPSEGPGYRGPEGGATSGVRLHRGR